MEKRERERLEARDSRLFRGGPREEDRRFSQKFGGRGRRFCRVKSCRRRRRRRRFSTKEKFRSSVWDCPNNSAVPRRSFVHGSPILIRNSILPRQPFMPRFNTEPFFEIVSRYRMENSSFSPASIYGIRKKKGALNRQLSFRNINKC